MSKFIVSYRNFTPIVDGLRECGYTVLENVWEPTDEQLNGCIGYLVCMYDGIKRPLRFMKLKRKLRQHRVPLIGWNRDGPWNKGEKPWRLWMLKHLDLLDIHATHTLQDSKDFAPEMLYLPNAAWTAAYHLGDIAIETLRDPSRYHFDVSFFGRIDARKYPEMRERERFLLELQQRLAHWQVSCRFTHTDNMPLREQVELVQRSRINLNYWAGADEGVLKGGEASWGLPERCYGIQACGGFLLSDERRHAADDFVPGKEWVSFGSLDDCVEKIRYYLSHFGEARAIAEAAHARVMRDHAYVNRAATLIRVAKAWKTKLAIAGDARLGAA